MGKEQRDKGYLSEADKAKIARLAREQEEKTGAPKEETPQAVAELHDALLKNQDAADAFAVIFGVHPRGRDADQDLADRMVKEYLPQEGKPESTEEPKH